MNLGDARIKAQGEVRIRMKFNRISGEDLNKIGEQASKIQRMDSLVDESNPDHDDCPPNELVVTGNIFKYINIKLIIIYFNYFNK